MKVLCVGDVGHLPPSRQSWGEIWIRSSSFRRPPSHAELSALRYFDSCNVYFQQRSNRPRPSRTFDYSTSLCRNLTRLAPTLRTIVWAVASRRLPDSSKLASVASGTRHCCGNSVTLMVPRI